MKNYNHYFFIAPLFLIIFLNGETQAQAQLNWGLLTPRESIGDAFFRGQEEAQRMQMQQMQIENMRIQNEIQMREMQRRENERRQQQYQTEQARRANEERAKSAAAASAQSSAADPTFVAFEIAAAPRKHLYPDFESVAYALDVPITVDMIKLMTGSPFAADIAYYLGKNKSEATAISQMPMLQASKAITNIENTIAQRAPRRQ